MSSLIKQSLTCLTDLEFKQLQQLAAKQNMTIDEWLEFSLKAQIYRNAEKLLMEDNAQLKTTYSL